MAGEMLCVVAKRLPPPHPLGNQAMTVAKSPASAVPLAFQATVPFRFGCFFVLLMCFPSFPELPGGTSLALLLMLACLPLWYNAARARQAPVMDEPASRSAAVILACVALLILWSLISVLDADVPFRAARYLASLMAAVSIYFLVVGTVNKRRMLVYLDLACVGLAASSLLSFFAYFNSGLQEVIFRGSDRSSGFFKNPNQFGMAISTMVPVLTALILSSPHLRRLRVLCWALLILGLIACGSKTNLIISMTTILIVLLSFSFVAFTGAKRAIMAVLSIVGTVALVGGGGVLLMMFNPRTLRLMLTFLSQDKELASLVSRDQLWRNSIQQFVADPVLGQGAGQPINIFVQNEFVPHSHNVLLDYLRTLGAPGFFTMLVLLGAAAYLCGLTLIAGFRAQGCNVENRMLCIGLTISATAYMTANMSSDSMGPSTSPFFWLVLFLSFAARRLLGLSAGRMVV